MTQEIDQSLGPMGVKARLMPLVFQHGASMHEARRAALFAATSMLNAADVVAWSMEALYGVVKDGGAPGAVVEVCAQCAHVVCVNNFHGKADRASGVIQACRRELGLTADADTPDPETDPTPDALPEPPAEPEA